MFVANFVIDPDNSNSFSSINLLVRTSDMGIKNVFRIHWLESFERINICWQDYSCLLAGVLHLKREEQLDSVAFFMGDPSQADYLLNSFEFQLMFEFVVDQFVFYTNRLVKHSLHFKASLY
mgnify:CR=1 FL=1